MVDAWQASGLSMRAYAQQVVINKRWLNPLCPRKRRRPPCIWFPFRLARSEALRMVTAWKFLLISACVFR